MSDARVGGVRLFYESAGRGSRTLVLVHGSWSSHRNWHAVVPALAESFRVVAYDRRGHSLSERPSTQGSVLEDVDDLAGLIEQLDLAPAFVAGSSFGATIALRFAGARPDLVRAVIAHEPPLFPWLAIPKPPTWPKTSAAASARWSNVSRPGITPARRNSSSRRWPSGRDRGHGFPRRCGTS
jgi:pimeloyl-ACP methyl ester carboxylesterase